MIKLRVKECCRAHGITQKELATRLGIKPISLSQMIARKGFSVERLGEMADAIGCSVAELIAESKEEEQTAKAMTCPRCGAALSVEVSIHAAEEK